MARIAARRRSEADIRRLTEVLAEQEAAFDDLPMFRALDGRFHREIAGISGNPIFRVMIDAVFRRLSDFHGELVSVPGLENLTLAEHREILDSTGRPTGRGAARCSRST